MTVWGVTMTVWEIIDNNGILFSGTERDMKRIWDNIINERIDVSWGGDLKLVEVHKIYR